MKGREKVMSLEAELAHHTHQLNDAQAALESQTSQVQVSLWMFCCGWVCCPQPSSLHPFLSGAAESAELYGEGTGVCQERLCSGSH